MSNLIDPKECTHEPELVIRNTELRIIMRMCKCGQYKKRTVDIRKT